MAFKLMPNIIQGNLIFIYLFIYFWWKRSETCLPIYAYPNIHSLSLSAYRSKRRVGVETLIAEIHKLLINDC